MEAPHEVTVLFADLSGYTALTEAHGDLDAADVATAFQRLANAALVGETRVVKTMGDGLMAIARNAGEAVATALRLAAAVNATPRFPAVHVGLHRGQVVERDGDYFGSTVNLASRVAAHAGPGEVLCTSAVAEALPAGCFALAAAGTALLKNVADPVELYRVLHACAGTERAVDPVCRMVLEPGPAVVQLEHDGCTYSFCSAGCAERFRAVPARYVT